MATTIDRLIEISHWGNIAVEEKIQIVHKGAKLTVSINVYKIFSVACTYSYLKLYEKL